MDYLSKARMVAQPLAESMGLSIWGAEFVPGGRAVLRFFVEKSKGIRQLSQNSPVCECVEQIESVSVNECAEFSRLLGLALDAEGNFNFTWVLEVSSPGFERLFFSLEQLNGFIGQTISVTVNDTPLDWKDTGVQSKQRKKFVGTLLQVNDGKFTLSIPKAQRLPDEPEVVSIDWNSVRRAHLVHDFSSGFTASKFLKGNSKAKGRKL